MSDVSDYDGVRVRLAGDVQLSGIIIKTQELKTDYNRAEKLPTWIVEGTWLLNPAFKSMMLTRSYNSQRLEMLLVVSKEMHSELISEITREHHLNEVYKLEIRNIAVNLRPQRSYRYDRKKTFPVVVDGYGCHSKVSSEASNFTTTNDAGPVTCAILRDTLMQHLGVDIGEYPREDK